MLWIVVDADVASRIAKVICVGDIRIIRLKMNIIRGVLPSEFHRCLIFYIEEFCNQSQYIKELCLFIRQSKAAHVLSIEFLFVSIIYKK